MAHESLETKRAQIAWANVKAVESAKVGSDYYSLIRGFPGMLHGSSIGQALALLLSKREAAHKRLADHLAEWLIKHSRLPWSADNRKAPKSGEALDGRLLLEMLLEEPVTFWWVADKEAIEFCCWLKRYSESFHSGDSGFERKKS